MANLAISGDTSGAVTIAAPAVAGTTTITLPATSGTMALTSQIPAAATGTLIRTPQYLTSGTSYTTPVNCNSIYVELIGGGGGGGGIGASGNQNAGAGGGGAYATKYFSVTGNTAYTYAIGSGGNGGPASVSNGTAGGNTTFTVGAVTVIAGGGGAGLSSGNGSGAGGTATNADFSYAGLPGNFLGSVSNTNLNPSGSSGGIVVGPLFNGGYAYTYPQTGASISAGVNATNYGCGGSGGVSGTNGAAARAGGNGFQGLIRITEYT